MKQYNNITIYIIILYMTDYEHLSIDLSGIDISGTGRIIIDNSGTINTTGDLSCNKIDVSNINSANISTNDITVTNIDINGRTFPSGGSNGQVLKLSNGELSWQNDNNTTYSIGNGGLTQNNFTNTLKSKLDNIASNANNYSLPTASSNTLGGIKIGNNLTIDGNGVLSGTGGGTFLSLTDTPNSYNANKFLAVNSGGNGVEFVDAPSGGSSGSSNSNTTSGGSDILLFFADVINASVHASNSIVNIYTSYKYSISGGGKESAFSNPIVKGTNFIASSEASTTTSWGTYVRKLTLPKGIPSELEVIIKGRVCGQGNGEGQLIVKRGSNTIYNRELGATAYACGQFTVNHIFTDFREGDTLEFYLNENNGAASTNGDPQVFNFTDGGNKQRGSITIKALNDVGGNTTIYTNLINNEQLVTKKGQTLETIAGVCDGRTIEGDSGTYTLPNVTQPQECADGSPWAELTGSKISYKPPSGTKQVIYKLHIHMSGTEFGSYSNSHSFVASMRIKLDNTTITNFDYHEGNSSTHDSVIVLTAIFDIGSEDNVSEAKLLSWNSNKEIKIEVTGYPYPPRTIMYHSAQYRIDNGSDTRGDLQTLSTIQVIKPRMEIISIGEKTEKANATYVVAKQGEMRLTHDKANVKDFKWFREDDERDTGSTQIARSITDDNPVLGSDNQWWPGTGFYSSDSGRSIFTTSNPGTYTGNGSTIVDGVAKPGIWFEWEFFEKVKASRFRISSSGARLYGGYDGAPTYITIAGSNDGSTWYSVNSEETMSISDYDGGTTTISGSSNKKISKFAERNLESTKIASYKFYRLIIRGRINDPDPTTTNDTSYRLLIGEFELIGKVEIDSYPVNNTTLVVANSKGIRVTHDKGNIINFTFPTNDGQRGVHELVGNLTDDKGVHQSVRENVFHSRYDDGKSAFQQVTGNYTGFDNVQETTTDVNGITYAGLWFQWEFVSKVKINSMRMMGYSKSSYTLHQNSVPQKSKIFGSNDGTTWYPLADEFDTLNSNEYYNADEAIWKNYTINATKEYKYIRYAVNKVCGNWGLNDDSWLVLSELEMFGDVILEQAGVTNIIKGQVLEKIAGIADGKKLEGRENTYTLDNVTQLLEIRENTDGNPDENQIYPVGTDAITPGHVGVTGSKIENYTLLHGTKQIVYIFTCHVSSLSQWTTITFNLLVDNQVVHGQHRGDGSNQYRNGSVSTRFVIDITDGVEDISLGKINWSVGESKTIRLEASDRYRAVLHTGNQYINDTYPHQQNEIIKPQVELTAIGEKTTVNSFVPHDGMTIQTQHKDYKKKVMKDNANWDAIDDDLDTGFVVKIQPTSANSKVMINTTVHIGMIMGNSHDARWWGARLWRKIGSGSWLEVTEANGDETRETLGTTTLANNGGTKCWFSNTSGIENSATEDILIANVTASFLDSPNTNDTIYYTIRWGSRLGNLSVNSTLYLNRAHSQHDAYRPAPMSSITASEIWSSGSPYVPPTDGVISVYNNKIGIDNTTPTYDLDVSGNINFTGTLYQDGVAFSGGGGGGSGGSKLLNYIEFKGFAKYDFTEQGSTNSQSRLEITQLTLTVTPSKTSSKIHIQYHVSFTSKNNLTFIVSRTINGVESFGENNTLGAPGQFNTGIASAEEVHFYYNSTWIDSGMSNGGMLQTTAFQFIDDTHNTTDNVIYKLYVGNSGQKSGHEFTLNAAKNSSGLVGSDGYYDERGTSSIVAIEYEGSGSGGNSDAFQTSGSNAYYNSGNVGIGTTTPETELHIYSTNQNEGAYITLESDGGSGGIPSAGLLFKTNDGTPTNPNDTNNTYLASKIYSSWESNSGLWNKSYIGFQTHHTNSSTLNDSMIIKGGNVGIGNNTPVYTLDINGDINISAGSKFRINGTEQTFGSGAFQTSGSNAYYNSGNVGIGISSPLTYLHIKGTHPANTNLTNADDFYMLLGSDEWNNNSYRLIGFGFIDNSTKCPPAYIGYKTADADYDTKGDLIFGTRNSTTGTVIPSERMRITSSGNIGIGTTNPSNLLTVKGGNLVSCFKTEGTQYGGYRSSYIGFTNETTTDTCYMGIDGMGLCNFETGALVLGTWRDKSIIFTTGQSNSEKMRITSSGNVGVGTTNPSYPFHVKKTTNNLNMGNNMFHMDNEQGSSSEAYKYEHYGHGNGASPIYYGWHSARLNGNVSWSPWLGTGPGDTSVSNFDNATFFNNVSAWFEGGISMAYTVTRSDRRIKTDISMIDDAAALTMVNSIETKEYNYTDPFRRRNIKTVGFIAQEVKEVFPNAVGIEVNFIPDVMRVIENPVWIDCSYSTIRYEPKFTYTETVTYEEGPLIDSSGNPILDQSGNQIIDPSAIQIIDPSGIEHVDPSGIVIEEWHPKWKLQIHDLDMSSNNTGVCRFYFSNDISGNDEIMKEVKLDISSNNTFEAIDERYNNVFFYGKEVTDFHTLDKAQIFSLHHSAIQELSRKNNSLETKCNMLENKCNLLEIENNDFKKRLETLEQAFIDFQNSL